jgi:hypothetical protein
MHEHARDVLVPVKMIGVGMIEREFSVHVDAARFGKEFRDEKDPVDDDQVLYSGREHAVAGRSVLAVVTQGLLNIQLIQILLRMENGDLGRSEIPEIPRDDHMDIVFNSGIILYPIFKIFEVRRKCETKDLIVQRKCGHKDLHPDDLSSNNVILHKLRKNVVAIGEREDRDMDLYFFHVCGRQKPERDGMMRLTAGKKIHYDISIEEDIFHYLYFFSR